MTATAIRDGSATANSEIDTQSDTFASEDETFVDLSVRTKNPLGIYYARFGLLSYLPDAWRMLRDPVLARKGLEVYDDMILDDMVEAGYNAITSIVLTEYRVTPSDESNEEAVKVATSFAYMLEQIPGGFLTKLYEVLLALLYGFSISEIKFGISLDGPTPGWICVSDIIYRQPHFFDFGIDKETGEIDCIHQLDAYGKKKHTLPSWKAFHYVWNKHVHSQRGRSMLRPAYEPWFAKMASFRLRNQQAERYAGKVKVTKTDKTIQDKVFSDAADIVIKDFQFSIGFKVPAGMTADPVVGENSPQALSDMIDHCSKAILRALGVPWLLIEEGIKSGNFALTKIQNEQFLTRLRRVKQDLEELVREKLFRRLCILNGIPLALCPKFDMTPISAEERRTKTQTYLELLREGAIDKIPGDHAWLRKMNDLPMPTESHELDNVPKSPDDIVGPDPNVATPAATPVTAPTAAVPAAGETIQDLAMNGAQIEAAKAIVLEAANGIIPFETAIEMLIGFLTIRREVAQRIMQPFVNGFKPKPPEGSQPTQPMQQGAFPSQYSQASFNRREYGMFYDKATTPQAKAPIYRSLSEMEDRVNYNAVQKGLDRIVDDQRVKLSALWRKAVEHYEARVIRLASVKGKDSDTLLREIEALEFDLAEFETELHEGSVAVYEMGKDLAAEELHKAGLQIVEGLDGVSEKHATKQDPYSLGHFAGLMKARAFRVVKGFKEQALSAIANSLMTGIEGGLKLDDKIAKLGETFRSLAAGNFIKPGTPGWDFTKPAIQETTVRTLYNNAMNGGRNDLFERNAGFVVGTERSEVLEPERNHPLSPIVDQLRIALDDPRRRQLTGSLHFNDRGVDVPITRIDANKPGFTWSSSADIDRAIAAGKRLSPRFFSYDPDGFQRMLDEPFSFSFWS